ncbi:MAG: plastocyanin/azurin family copper-binding protein [Thermodesulfobacteriota bacterium]
MSRFRVLLVTLLASFFLFGGLAQAAYSEFVESFLKAYDSKDVLGMGKIVEANKDKVPAEVRALVEEALKEGIDPVDKTSHFFVGELIAREYSNQTEDSSILIELKQKEFNSFLHKAVQPKAVKGVVTVNIPVAAEKVKNVFTPDNVIINEGETVRWTNSDSIAHIFASMPLIGKGGIFTPSLEPGGTWEFKFDKPGDYYYICFIHKGMIGKVRVLAKEAEETPPATDTKAGEKKKRDSMKKAE